MGKDASSQPLYYKVALDLKDMVARGELRPGDRLPREVQLMERYGVSRVTVRKALQELNDLGVTEHRGRRGHFVQSLRGGCELPKGRSLFQTTLASGRTPSSKILSMRMIEASSGVAAVLDVEPGAGLIEVKRLRYADDMPFAHEALLLPQDLFDGLNPWEMERRSLVDIIQQSYGIEPGYSTQSLKAQLPTKEEAALLGSDPSLPLLMVSSCMYDRSGRGIKRSHLLINTAVMEYSFTLLS